MWPEVSSCAFFNFVHTDKKIGKILKGDQIYSWQFLIPKETQFYVAKI
jgi:hypothetical protein